MHQDDALVFNICECLIMLTDHILQNALTLHFLWNCWWIMYYLQS